MQALQWLAQAQQHPSRALRSSRATLTCSWPSSASAGSTGLGALTCSERKCTMIQIWRCTHVHAMRRRAMHRGSGASRSRSPWRGPGGRLLLRKPRVVSDGWPLAGTSASGMARSSRRFLPVGRGMASLVGIQASETDTSPLTDLIYFPGTPLTVCGFNIFSRNARPDRPTPSPACTCNLVPHELMSMKIKVYASEASCQTSGGRYLQAAMSAFAFIGVGIHR